MGELLLTVTFVGMAKRWPLNLGTLTSGRLMAVKLQNITWPLLNAEWYRWEWKGTGF